MPGGSKKGGGLKTKKSAFYKMKGFSGFGNSPTKHTTNRAGHEDIYGKGHDKSAHPDYWKKTKTRYERDNELEATTSAKEREIAKTKYLKEHRGGNPRYWMVERKKK